MKRVFAFIFALIFAVMLASCGEAATEPTSAPTEEPTSAPTEAPTEEITAAPTEEPTSAPTEATEPPAVHVHTYAECPIILPTTTSEGRAAGVICITCGDVQSGGEPIPKLTASASTATELPLDFNTFKDDLNAARHEKYDNFEFPEFPDLTPDSDEPALTDEEARTLATERDRVATITKEQAIEDADLYFRALKDSYAMYYYLGEDKFLAARDSVMEQLNSLDDNATIDTNSFYSEILVASTEKFITDLHYPHNTRDYVQYYYYYVSGLFFHKDTDGYYFKNGDDKWYVVGIDGGNIADYIKLTISPEGELVYGIGYKFLKVDNDRPAYIVIKNGDVELNYSILWTLSDTTSGRYESNLSDFYSTSVIDGYNVIRESCLPSGDERCVAFAETGKTLKGESNLILDFRGNGGGSNGYTWDWIRNYTDGLFGSWYGEHWRINSPLVHYCDSNNGEETDKYTTKGWIKYNGSIGKNDNTVFWLADNQCGSSGDASILSAQFQESMIVIGTQTAGCHGVGGEWMNIYLPNSGIRFSYRPFIDMDGCKDAHCVGYDPDIWVPSEYALELTLAMCKYYGLEPDEKKLEEVGNGPDRVDLALYAATETKSIALNNGNNFVLTETNITTAGGTYDVYYTGEKIIDFAVTVESGYEDYVKVENGQISILPEADFKNFSFSIIYNGVYSKFHVNCKGEETDDISLKIGLYTINAGEGFGGIGYKGTVYYKGKQITDFTVVVPDDTNGTVINDNGKLKIIPKANGDCTFYVIYNGMYAQFGCRMNPSNYGGDDNIEILIGSNKITVDNNSISANIGKKGDVLYKGEKVTDFTVEIISGEKYGNIVNRNGSIVCEVKSAGRIRFRVYYNGAYAEFVWSVK